MIAFLIYIFLGLSCYYVFYKKTQDALNPFGISLMMWLVPAGLSCLRLYPGQQELSWETHVCISLAAWEIFLVGMVILYKWKPKKDSNGQIIYSRPVATSSYRFFMTIIVTLSFTVAIANWVLNGMNINAGNQELGLDTKSAMAFSNSVTSGGEYLGYVFPFTGLFLLYDILFDSRKNKRTLYMEIAGIAFVLFYSWFVLVSRGTLTAVLLGGLFLFNTRKRISPIKIFGSATILGGLFGWLMTIRLSDTGLSVFVGASDNIVFNTIYNYIAITYQVFDNLVCLGSPYTIIEGSWITVSKILGLYSPADLHLLEITPFNAATFLYWFYHDLGIGGVLVYPTFIFLVIGVMYLKSVTTFPAIVLLLATLQKALWTLFFGNYFFGSFSTDVQYFVTAFLILLAYKIRINGRHDFGMKNKAMYRTNE